MPNQSLMCTSHGNVQCAVLQCAMCNVQCASLPGWSSHRPHQQTMLWLTGCQCELERHCSLARFWWALAQLEAAVLYPREGDQCTVHGHQAQELCLGMALHASTPSVTSKYPRVHKVHSKTAMHAHAHQAQELCLGLALHASTLTIITNIMSQKDNSAWPLGTGAVLRDGPACKHTRCGIGQLGKSQ
jgi:hypothetical protein